LSADITTLNLNSTASISGGTAGLIAVTGALNNPTISNTSNWANGSTAQINIGDTSTILYNIYGGATGFTTNNIFTLQGRGSTNVLFNNQAIYASANNTHSLGTSSIYWSNTYSSRYYLNSTTYIDGGTAGQATLTGTLTSQTVTPVTTATYTLGDSLHYYLSADITTLNLNSTASLSGGTAGVANLTGSFNQTGNGITIGSSTAGISTTGNDVVLTMNSSNTAFRATRTNTWGDSASALFFEIGNSSDNAVFTLKNGSTIGRLAFTTGVVQFFASYFTSLPTPTANNLLELINSSSSKVFSVNNVGKIQLAVGANTSIGTAVLTAGTVTVSTTAVTASSLIFLTCQALGTVTVASALSVGTIVAGTSFVINSAVVTDTSTIGWWIIN
jgi:hypothetical protein